MYGIVIFFLPFNLYSFFQSSFKDKFKSEFFYFKNFYIYNFRQFVNKTGYVWIVRFKYYK
jgi:hypothetical protein